MRRSTGGKGRERRGKQTSSSSTQDHDTDYDNGCYNGAANYNSGSEMEQVIEMGMRLVMGQSSVDSSDESHCMVLILECKSSDLVSSFLRLKYAAKEASDHDHDHEHEHERARAHGYGLEKETGKGKGKGKGAADDIGSMLKDEILTIDVEDVYSELMKAYKPVMHGLIPSVTGHFGSNNGKRNGNGNGNNFSKDEQSFARVTGVRRLCDIDSMEIRSAQAYFLTMMNIHSRKKEFKELRHKVKDFRRGKSKAGLGTGAGTEAGAGAGTKPKPKPKPSNAYDESDDEGENEESDTEAEEEGEGGNDEEGENESSAVQTMKKLYRGYGIDEIEMPFWRLYANIAQPPSLTFLATLNALRKNLEDFSTYQKVHKSLFYMLLLTVWTTLPASFSHWYSSWTMFIFYPVVFAVCSSALYFLYADTRSDIHVRLHKGLLKFTRKTLFMSELNVPDIRFAMARLVFDLSFVFLTCWSNSQRVQWRNEQKLRMLTLVSDADADAGADVGADAGADADAEEARRGNAGHGKDSLCENPIPKNYADYPSAVLGKETDLDILGAQTPKHESILFSATTDDGFGTPNDIGAATLKAETYSLPTQTLLLVFALVYGAALLSKLLQRFVPWSERMRWLPIGFVSVMNFPSYRAPAFLLSKLPAIVSSLLLVSAIGETDAGFIVVAIWIACHPLLSNTWLGLLFLGLPVAVEYVIDLALRYVVRLLFPPLIAMTLYIVGELWICKYLTGILWNTLYADMQSLYDDAWFTWAYEWLIHRIFAGIILAVSLSNVYGKGTSLLQVMFTNTNSSSAEHSRGTLSWNADFGKAVKEEAFLIPARLKSVAWQMYSSQTARSYAKKAVVIAYAAFHSVKGKIHPILSQVYRKFVQPLFQSISADFVDMGNSFWENLRERFPTTRSSNANAFSRSSSSSPPASSSSSSSSSSPSSPSPQSQSGTQPSRGMSRSGKQTSEKHSASKSLNFNSNSETSGTKSAAQKRNRNKKRTKKNENLRAVSMNEHVKSGVDMNRDDAARTHEEQCLCSEDRAQQQERNVFTSTNAAAATDVHADTDADDARADTTDDAHADTYADDAHAEIDTSNTAKRGASEEATSQNSSSMYNNNSEPLPKSMAEKEDEPRQGVSDQHGTATGEQQKHQQQQHQQHQQHQSSLDHINHDNPSIFNDLPELEYVGEVFVVQNTNDDDEASQDD